MTRFASVTIVLLTVLVVLITTQVAAIIGWIFVPDTRVALTLPFQWAIALGVLVTTLYSIGLVGAARQRRWGPLVVCGTVALDSIDIISGLMNSIDKLYAVGGSIFLTLVFVTAYAEYRRYT
ncbi:MAG: hypothetical protein WBZ42_07485 [Halobacteriota archaeon]